jgi:hypothetical protein
MPQAPEELTCLTLRLKLSAGSPGSARKLASQGWAMAIRRLRKGTLPRPAPLPKGPKVTLGEYAKRLGILPSALYRQPANGRASGLEGIFCG